MNIIEVTHVSMEFKHHLLFDNLSFSCQKGQIIGIVGENGSGKSVLFKLIAGFLKPAKGQITVKQTEITKTNSFPENLGVLIEEPSFLAELTGFENLKLLSSIKNKLSDTEIHSTMKSVNLFSEKDKKVQAYSLGMKKKLGIAQAIMEYQDVILLDEPMNGLDEKSIIKIRQLLRKMAEEGATILLASHNKEDIHELCNRVYRIEQKVLIEIPIHS